MPVPIPPQKDPWRKNKNVTLISYSDMTFAGLSMALSIHAFVNSLPYSKEDSQMLHDGMVIVFMALVIVHFVQLFEAVMLLSASEIVDDPLGAITLATSWANWSIFFTVLLMGKLAAVVFALEVNLWYAVYITFILAEIVFRPLWRRHVNGFVMDLKTAFPAVVGYVP